MEVNINIRCKDLKTNQESATNVNNHIALVESEIEKATQSLVQYKFQVEDLKQELNTMKQKALINNEDITDNLTPQIDNLEKNLKNVIGQQKDQNAKFQNQITELKKEKVQIQSLIVGCVGKVQTLEDMVGNYS